MFASQAFFSVVGSSAGMRHVLRIAERVAANPAYSVVLVGAAGTGKELLARCIHRGGPSSDEPFISVSCSALPAELLEAELLGADEGGPRRRGAFELAGRGTVFLRDLAALPRALQPALLRVLESRRLAGGAGGGEVRTECRVIVSGKQPLAALVESGLLIPALAQRLEALAIALPPLRERRTDIIQLAEYFLLSFSRTSGVAPATLTADARDALQAHAWPGNVRELRYVLESAAVLAGDRPIVPEHLRLQRRHARVADGAERVIRFPASGKTLADIEREAMDIALELTAGNQSAAARMLGISRHTLLRRLQAEQGLNDELCDVMRPALRA